MNRYRSLPHHLFASSLLAIAITGVPQAQAFYNNKIVPPALVSDWSGFQTYGEDPTLQCAAFALMPHVTLSSRSCVPWGNAQFFYPKTLTYIFQQTVIDYEGPDTNDGDIGNLSLSLLPADMEGLGKSVDILSYRKEQQVLVDGNETMTSGTAFILYGGTRAASYNQRKVATSEYYVNPLTRQMDSRRLIYRSIPKYRQLEPERFNPNVSNALFSANAVNFFAGRKFTDQQINSMVLLTAGLQSDPGDGIASPIADSDGGSGIFLLGTNGANPSLVGIASTSTVHTRLSHYWPWVYQTMVDNDLKDEAIQFAHKVLGTGNWGDNDRKGTIGDIYVYDNPYTQNVEFFRLTGLWSDQRYGWFPTNKGNNEYWQYLGTSLPSAEEALKNVRPATQVGVIGGNPAYTLAETSPAPSKVTSDGFFFETKALPPPRLQPAGPSLEELNRQAPTASVGSTAANATTAAADFGPVGTSRLQPSLTASPANTGSTASNATIAAPDFGPVRTSRLQPSLPASPPNTVSTASNATIAAPDFGPVRTSRLQPSLTASPPNAVSTDGWFHAMAEPNYQPDAPALVAVHQPTPPPPPPVVQAPAVAVAATPTVADARLFALRMAEWMKGFLSR